MIAEKSGWEEMGDIDMCKALDNRIKKEKVSGAIDAFRLVGVSEEDIISKVMNLYNVSKEYVLALLSPQKM